MKASVIVTTYNRPDALASVLRGLAAQDDRDFEVLIADDGSRPDTAELVLRSSHDFPVPLRHVWQADDGFRAGAARNRACTQATGEYLIFIDGDCIALPHFVRRHKQLAEPGWFVAGNRILLSEDFTTQALARALPLHMRRTHQWWLDSWCGRINRWLPLVQAPDGAWRKRSPQRWQGARTCNLAVWRQDFEEVNGFDEAYAGWGHEDADLAIRLIRLGVQRKDGRFATAVMHLWHRENDRSQLEENVRRLETILASQRIRAQHGLSQYLRPDA
jgi:glycosyltransferase involved in cell wall biosynthesis